MKRPRLHLLGVCAALGAVVVVSFWCYSGKKSSLNSNASVLSQRHLLAESIRSTKKPATVTADFPSSPEAQSTKLLNGNNGEKSQSGTKLGAVMKTVAAPDSVPNKPPTYRQAFGHKPILSEEALSERPDLLTREELEYRALQISAEADRELARLLTVLKLDPHDEDIVYEALAHTSSYYVPGMRFAVTTPEESPSPAPMKMKPAPKLIGSGGTQPTQNQPQPTQPSEVSTPPLPSLNSPLPPENVQPTLPPTPEIVKHMPPQPITDPAKIEPREDDLGTRSLDDEGREFWLDILETFDQKMRNGSN